VLLGLHAHNRQGQHVVRRQKGTALEGGTNYRERGSDYIAPSKQVKLEREAFKAKAEGKVRGFRMERRDGKEKGETGTAATMFQRPSPRKNIKAAHKKLSKPRR